MNANTIRTKGVMPSDVASAKKDKEKPHLQLPRFDQRNIGLSTVIYAPLLDSIRGIDGLGISPTREPKIKNLFCPATLTELGQLSGPDETPEAIASGAWRYIRAT